MGSAKRYMKTRAKKRKLYPKKNHENSTESVDSNINKPSSSSQKIDLSFLDDNSDEESQVPVKECNVIINTDLLMSLILMIGRCPECDATVNITHDSMICRKRKDIYFPSTVLIVLGL